jgi:hypothetical protein
MKNLESLQLEMKRPAPQSDDDGDTDFVTLRSRGHRHHLWDRKTADTMLSESLARAPVVLFRQAGTVQLQLRALLPI